MPSDEEEEYHPGSEEMDEGSGEDEEEEGGEDEVEEEEEADEEEISEFDRWVQEMPKRKFICEREFDISRVERHAAIEVITNAGLSFFFKPLKSFRQGICKSFYANMVIEDNKRIVSRIGEVEVKVTLKCPLKL